MNTFTAQELADFYQKVADGGEIEYDSMPHGWLPSWVSPCLSSVRQDWRIKPTEQVIDLSVLIESGIDCEFSLDNRFWYVDKLSQILREGYSGKVYAEWKYCRPRMNHIHAWQGGDCPLPEGFKVKVWCRDMRKALSGNRVTEFNWTHDSDSREDIIAFEVLGLADGYVMPWEQDNE